MIGVLGVGAIAEAMVTGWCNGVGEPPTIVVSPRGRDGRRRSRPRFPTVQVAAHNQEVLDRPDAWPCGPRTWPRRSAARPEHRERRRPATSAWWRTQPDVLARAVPLPAVARRRGVTAVFPVRSPGRTPSLREELGQVLGGRRRAEPGRPVGVDARRSPPTWPTWPRSASWLTARGIPEEDASRYVVSTFAGVSEELERRPTGLPELADAHATPGGLNEQFLGTFATGRLPRPRRAWARRGGRPGLRLGLGGGELAAGAVDLAAAGVAHRGRDALRLQPPDELALVGRVGGGPLRPGVGFSGIRLTCTQPQSPYELSTSASRSARQAWSLMPRIMAYSIETRRLVTLGVVPGGLDRLGDRPAGVDRHQLVAQLVVGRVQADSASVTGMPSSASWRIRGTSPTVETVTPRADMPSPSGAGSVEPAYGADHGPVVGERLPHAHEDDVGDAARSARHLAAGQRAGAGDDLLDDLGRGHVALQAALAGRAERAGHAAAGLAGHAHA